VAGSTACRTWARDFQLRQPPEYSPITCELRRSFRAEVFPGGDGVANAGARQQRAPFWSRLQTVRPRLPATQRAGATRHATDPVRSLRDRLRP
jgi:hypothetical protein